MRQKRGLCVNSTEAGEASNAVTFFDKSVNTVQQKGFICIRQKNRRE